MYVLTGLAFGPEMRKLEGLPDGLTAKEWRCKKQGGGQ
jgi:hypothetical protein